MLGARGSQVAARACDFSVFARLNMQEHADRSTMCEVDLLVENPIDFDLLYERSKIIALATTSVRIVSIEDLIQLKRLANRPEDQRDIEALQAIRRSKRDG